MRDVKALVAGAWETGERTVAVENKYTGEPEFEVHVPSRAQVGRATAALAEAQQRISFPPYERYTSLLRAVDLLTERQAEFTDTMLRESGFTLTEVTNEINRAKQTLILSGEEAKRITGEMVPVDSAPGGSSRIGFTVRRPVGVVCAITPFNSPLNTLLHKVAPALAAGNAVVIKPALVTPATAELTVRLLVDAGVPVELLSFLPGNGSTVGQWLLEDPIPSYYAFTGSTEIGLHIRRTIGVRRAQLELGSLSSTIVCKDADLERVAALCVNAAFRKAGQVCTSIQRLYAHTSVISELSSAMDALLATRPVGDPRNADTFVGPVISASEADRITTWVREAVDGGAHLVRGGEADGRVVAPTILTDVRPDMTVMSQEVFGPVVMLRPFSDLDDAIDEANNTPFGLSAGVFTTDIGTALSAAERLRFGCVHINETSSSRSDLMPFGGVKASGSGHEGPKYAIRDMTEERLITIGG